MCQSLSECVFEAFSTIRSPNRELTPLKSDSKKKRRFGKD
jgi:hypothetical protein